MAGPLAVTASLIKKETEYEKGWAWGQARPPQKKLDYFSIFF
jgi:hypothetical protein